MSPADPTTDGRTADERTIDELLVAAEEVAATGGTLTRTLASISADAAECGVAVTVDLHGKLTGLTIDRQAMALRPDDLAARIQRLCEQATSVALAEGVAALADVVDTGALGLDDYRRKPVRDETPVDDEDFFTPTTWRMS